MISNFGFLVQNKTYELLLNSTDKSKFFLAYLEQEKLPVSPDSLGLYLQHMKDEGKAATTVNTHLSASKQLLIRIFEESPQRFDMMERFQLQYHLKKFKAEPLMSRMVDEQKILSDEELKTMIKRAGKRTKLIIIFLSQTGLRATELVNIRKDRIYPVNEEVSKIRIRGKRNKERWIPVSLSLVNQIKEVFTASNVWLFSCRDGSQYQRQTIYLMINKTAIKSLGRRCGPHMLRHTFATRNIENHPEKLDAISKMLGHHSSSMTTDMYCHTVLTPKEIIEAIPIGIVEG